MWLFKNTAELYICSETDDKSLSNFLHLLSRLGGIKINEKNTLVGSQDITYITYKFKDDKLLITIETYSGVTLSGSKDVIDMISDELKKTNKND